MGGVPPPCRTRYSGGMDSSRTRLHPDSLPDKIVYQTRCKAFAVPDSRCSGSGSTDPRLLPSRPDIVANSSRRRTDSSAPVGDYVLSTHNWSSVVNLYELGSGKYRLEAFTSIPSDSYSLTFKLINANHTSVVYTVNLKILLPPVIEGQLGSIESPYTAYWTRTFLLNVTVWDGSRVNTPISGGDVRFIWNAGSLQGQLSEVLLGVYQYQIDANRVSPGSYSITVLANTTESSLANQTFYVTISSVPTEIEIPSLQEANVHLEYEFSEEYSFYWNNTLDDLGISSPETVTVETGLLKFFKNRFDRYRESVALKKRKILA